MKKKLLLCEDTPMSGRNRIGASVERPLSLASYHIVLDLSPKTHLSLLIISAPDFLFMKSVRCYWHLSNKIQYDTKYSDIQGWNHHTNILQMIIPYQFC